MKRRKVFTILILAVLVLGSAGAALAISSASYSMPKNTIEGGGAGGFAAASASYQLSTTTGGFLQTSASSASYEMCSGFLCGGQKFFFSLFKVFQPLVLRNNP